MHVSWLHGGGGEGPHLHARRLAAWRRRRRAPPPCTSTGYMEELGASGWEEAAGPGVGCLGPASGAAVERQSRSRPVQAAEVVRSQGRGEQSEAKRKPRPRGAGPRPSRSKAEEAVRGQADPRPRGQSKAEQSEANGAIRGRVELPSRAEGKSRTRGTGRRPSRSEAEGAAEAKWSCLREPRGRGAGSLHARETEPLSFLAVNS